RTRRGGDSPPPAPAQARGARRRARPRPAHGNPRDRTLERGHLPADGAGATRRLAPGRSGARTGHARSAAARSTALARGAARYQLALAAMARRGRAPALASLPEYAARAG